MTLEPAKHTPCKVCGSWVKIVSYEVRGRPLSPPILKRVCLNDSCSTQINNRQPGELGEEP
jgi:hypothetical protein